MMQAAVLKSSYLTKVAADVSHSAAAAAQRVEHDVRVLTGTKRVLPSQYSKRGIGTGTGRQEPDQKSISYGVLFATAAV